MLSRFRFASCILAAGAAALLSGCQTTENAVKPHATGDAAPAPAITSRPFGTTPDGQPITLYTLTSRSGFRVEIMNYGATVVSILAADRDGQRADVTLGYDTLDGYVGDTSYLGATAGRYANRIAKGRFTLDGRTYELATNNGENHLHGGRRGFNKVVWAAKPMQTKDGPALRLRYRSPAGEEGYPGRLDVTQTYTVTNDDVLRVEYKATTDAPTVVNLAHHSYFNLTGDPTQTILDHEMMINAAFFTPVDKGLIPTGELWRVDGTPMDFRTPTPIGRHINERDIQLGYGGGYDHNWVLQRTGTGLSLAARVHEPESGRVLEVWTTQPGLQFYSGNFLDGSIVGTGGVKYQHRTGFCLEAQHYPDSPNKPSFPSVVLRPWHTYRQTTEYRFRAE